MSSNSDIPKFIYDVFMSFCVEEDTTGSESFASDLYTALTSAGVDVFSCNHKLESDEEKISLSVLQAIERSRISIIVFSRNYTDSRWCLRELEKIMECRSNIGQVVVSVFYDVDPSEVPNQTHTMLIDNDRLLNWKTALLDAATISGFSVTHHGDEIKVIKEAVAHVTNLLDHRSYLFVAKHPVGLESRVPHAMIQLLNNSQHKNDVILLGILGAQGSGKTTIARALYNKLSRNFEAKSFLSNVGEANEKYDDALVSLQERLLFDICRIRETGIKSITRGKEFLKRGLSQKRILLVLDDVNNMKQLSALCGNREWFGSGSRIIITSRDVNILNTLGVDHIYRVEMLSYDESLELFCWHAFKRKCSPNDFAQISGEIVSYSTGGPLAIEVLGSSLFSREKFEWNVALKKLTRVPVGEPQSVLKMCFDKLDLKLQSMFLDIACFFVGMDQNDVIYALNNSGYSAGNGIAVLEANSLITIDEDNLLRMHSLVQQMGHEIIRSESRGRPEVPKEYEVFLSFRGEDTRASFVSHLHASLQTAGLHVFKDDDEIPRGEQISVSLLQAIGKSRIAIVVLSRNYAYSRWCMTELENIMQNCRTKSLLVVPVFYQVDPSEVRNQTGEFGKAFNDLVRRFLENSYKVESWKRDLTEVGGRAGFVVLNSKNESEDINKVVEDVTDLLDKKEMFVAEHPVGVESRVKDVVKLLNCHQSNNVLLLGLWGMGGIGKTTISKAIYNKVRRNFKAKSFLLNVREVWEQNNGQVSLQERLLSSVYKTMKIKIDTVDSGIMELKERLRQKRIFLVLDDVSKLEQLSALCGSRDWFGQGSRIIITTRDEDLLCRLEVDHVYRMKEMDKNESLELFSWHAFKQKSPSADFVEHSRDVVEYSGGLPLALQVIGSFLLTRGKRDWKSVLEKLKVIPNDEVLAKLKISFDGLSDDDLKDIFLDIAFFFIGMDRDDVIEILNDCGHYAETGISVLVQQSLITVDSKNKIGMHDLLRDMGRAIVRQKAKEEGQELSRLWRYQDLRDELSKDTKMASLKGLTLTKDTPTHMETKDFEKMKNLRLLQLAGIELVGDYKYLSRDIRWLCWHGFPSRYTPANFHPGSSVAIELKYSNLDRVWKKSQILQKLKLLNLSHSLNLTQTPDFSKLPNLEKLILKNCPNLSSVSHTIGDLKKILLINLKDCTSLRTLPRSIYKLMSLKTLILSGCSKIDKLEEDLELMESLTTLIADRTAITRVPFAVVRSKRIGYISLCGYEGLSRDVFPSIIWSWMSPTNSLLSSVRTSAGVSSLASLDEQNSNFYGLSSIIKDLQKLQRIWVKCDSEVQLNQNVKRILHTLSTCCEEIETMPHTSQQQVSNIQTSTFVDCRSLVSSASSKKFLASLLIQMGMNCHVTDILKESILQKMSPIEPDLLPGDNYPNWLTFNGEGSSVVSRVPEVNGRHLKTLMCIINYSSPESISSEEGLKNVLLINDTKKTIQLYKRDGLTFFEDDDEWQKVVSNIEPGDKVRVVVVFGNRFTVEKTTIYLVYDEPVDEETEHWLKANKNVIALGGDGNRTGELLVTLPSSVRAIMTLWPFMLVLVAILFWFCCYFDK